MNNSRQSSGSQRRAPTRWSHEEDATLRAAIETNPGKNWKEIALLLPGRTSVQCLNRWKKVLEPGLVTGPWAPEEDALLVKLVEEHGQNKWSLIANLLQGRLSKQCRERWCKHLNPDINKGPWTEEEDKILIKLHAKLGNKWAEIGKSLEGRTEYAIMTQWHVLKEKLYIQKDKVSAAKKRKSSDNTDNSSRKVKQNAMQVDQDVDAAAATLRALRKN